MNTPTTPQIETHPICAGDQTTKQLPSEVLEGIVELMELLNTNEYIAPWKDAFTENTLNYIGNPVFKLIGRQIFCNSYANRESIADDGTKLFALKVEISTIIQQLEKKEIVKIDTLSKENYNLIRSWYEITRLLTPLKLNNQENKKYKSLLVKYNENKELHAIYAHEKLTPFGHEFATRIYPKPQGVYEYIPRNTKSK